MLHLNASHQLANLKTCVTQGFFYNKFPEPKKGDLGTETDINLNQQLCYHVLGQPQSKDAVVWACPDHPAWMLGAEITDDGRCCSSCTSVACHSTLLDGAVCLQLIIELACIRYVCKRSG